MTLSRTVRATGTADVLRAFASALTAYTTVPQTTLMA